MNKNETALSNSLKALEKVFSGLTKYRVLGSVLVAAINGKPHRTLHDVDLLVDENIYPEVKSRFVKYGFKCVNKRAPGFKWDEYEKPDHLTFGILLVGKFGPDYFEYRANRLFKLKIKQAYLQPTEYTLMGHKILGIPIRSIYEGIKIASFNKKRKIDKAVILRATNNKVPVGLSISQAFRVNFLGLNIPYIYPFWSQIYNLIGGVRLRLGKSYDTWK